MSTPVQVEGQPNTASAPGKSSSFVPSDMLGLGLVLGWLAVFTVGSQMPHELYHDMLAHGGLRAVGGFLLHTLAEPNMSTLLLGVLASCLGMWRRRFQSPQKDSDAASAYVSATISGLVVAMITLAFPFLGSPILGFTPDQHTYNPFALAASIIAFYSGYDENVFDRIGAFVVHKLLPSDPQSH